MTTYEIDTPPPFPADVEALLEHERAISEMPTIVRARLMARARDSLRVPEFAVPRLARPAMLRPIWLAAAAGVALVATVAAAVQLFRGAEAAKPSAPVAPPAPAVFEPTPEPTPSLSPAPAAAPRASAAVRTEVAEELRLLDRARHADARGDHAGVLSVANEHERRFPHGRLAEDREVLRMRAYVGLGRRDDARATAGKFRRQFPRSVLLPKIDDLLDRMQ